MSVINTMLRDLDARQALAPHAPALAGEVRVAPPEGGRRPGLRPVVMALALAAAGGAILWLWQPAPPPAPAFAPVAMVTQAPAAEPGPAQDVRGSGLARERADGPAELPTRGQARSHLSRAEEAAPQAKTRPPRAAETPSRAADAPARKDESPAPSRAGASSASVAPPSLPAAPAPDLAPRARADAAPPSSAAPAAVASEPASRPEIHKLAVAQPELSPAQRREAELRRAAGLRQQGQAAEAELALRALLAEEPGYSAARHGLVALMTEQGRADEAQRLLQDGLALDPGNARLALPLARLLAQRSEWRAAGEVLGRAAGGAGVDAEFRALHGAVLQRLGRHGQAVDEYQAALRALPGAAAWWIGLGLSLEAQARLDEAREAFRRARQSPALSAELARFADLKLTQLP
ncbi:MAG: tetratricopeptide repeat protein [Betaproteobacteria bacterium]|nr:tetratricopeptide repeat protein [Betaproteobacteria bacterium]